MPEGLKISKKVAHLVHNMLLFHDKDRINFTEFFNHPFFHEDMMETNLRPMLESSRKSLDIRESTLLDDGLVDPKEEEAMCDFFLAIKDLESRVEVASIINEEQKEAESNVFEKMLEEKDEIIEILKLYEGCLPLK